MINIKNLKKPLTPNVTSNQFISLGNRSEALAVARRRRTPRRRAARRSWPAARRRLGVREGAQKRRSMWSETLQGLFSAVSKPNFASKNSLESSRRDLHNALLCTVLYSQNFVQKTAGLLLLFNFANFCQTLLDFADLFFQNEILFGRLK